MLSSVVQNLSGKIVLITGASTGIGRAAADRVAAAGATVIGTSRWPWRYPQPPNWSLFQMDQTSDDSVKQLISRSVIPLSCRASFMRDTTSQGSCHMKVSMIAVTATDSLS